MIDITGSDGNILHFDGKIDGVLSFENIDESGFGYDPIFIPEGFTQTAAELEPDVKNALSHRAQALSALVSYFRK